MAFFGQFFTMIRNYVISLSFIFQFSSVLTMFSLKILPIYPLFSLAKPSSNHSPSISRIFSFTSSLRLTSVQLSSFELLGLLSSAKISLDVSPSCGSFSVEFMFKEPTSESTLYQWGKKKGEKIEIKIEFGEAEDESNWREREREREMKMCRPETLQNIHHAKNIKE